MPLTSWFRSLSPQTQQDASLRPKATQSTRSSLDLTYKPIEVTAADADDTYEAVGNGVAGVATLSKLKREPHLNFAADNKLGGLAARADADKGAAMVLAPLPVGKTEALMQKGPELAEQSQIFASNHLVEQSAAPRAARPDTVFGRQDQPKASGSSLGAIHRVADNCFAAVAGGLFGLPGGVLAGFALGLPLKGAAMIIANGLQEEAYASAPLAREALQWSMALSMTAGAVTGAASPFASAEQLSAMKDTVRSGVKYWWWTTAGGYAGIAVGALVGQGAALALNADGQTILPSARLAGAVLIATLAGANAGPLTALLEESTAEKS